MGLNYSPKLNTDGLIFTHQPGQTTIFNNFTSSLAPDANTPVRGAVTGPRRKNIDYQGINDDINSVDGYGGTPTLSLQNIANSVYNLNTASTSTYTLSLWVKVVQFPTKYDSTVGYDNDTEDVTKVKRAALAKFDYSYSGTGNQYNGFIHFGAMAPYYKNASGTPNYKSVFSPISFGAAICCRTYQTSVYTDYKFNLNEWYLLTIQLQSNSTFDNNNQLLNVKMFVNDSQENIATCLGIAWRQNSKGGDRVKRREGRVAGQPGFYNCKNGGTVSNDSLQSITYNNFMNLSRLNCISYSPILQFGDSGVGQGPNNGTNQPINSATGHNSTLQVGSSINFGQTYIYNTAFKSSLYTQFKSLYS